MAAVETLAFELIDGPANQVGESPLWCPRSQHLWWVDIEGRALLRFDSHTGRSASWKTPQRIGCIALMADGALLGAMEGGLFRLDAQDDAPLAVAPLAEVAHARADMRFNDGRCDRAGRFWVSSMVRDTTLAAAQGLLYRYERGTPPSSRVAGLITGNGLAFSPRGDRMYLSDSHPSVQRIWAFDLSPEGEASRRREFVDMNAYPGRPDGAAVDAEGCYWICANDAGLLLRFTPAGTLDRQLQLPFSKPSMCAFGGAALDTLYVTSIQPARPETGNGPKLAGHVIALRPGVQGLAETPLK